MLNTGNESNFSSVTEMILGGATCSVVSIVGGAAPDTFTSQSPVIVSSAGTAASLAKTSVRLAIETNRLTHSANLINQYRQFATLSLRNAASTHFRFHVICF